MATKGQRFLIFATKNDWSPVLASLEAAYAIMYVQSGMSPLPRREEFESFKELPNFGTAASGNAVSERAYLMLLKGSRIQSRQVRMNTGEVRNVIDHENNPESVVFWPGGVLDNPKAVIQGEVSKLYRTKSAEVIFQTLSKLLRKHFLTVKVFRVGPEARLLKEQGYRLTASTGSSADYDLSFN